MKDYVVWRNTVLNSTPPLKNFTQMDTSDGLKRFYTFSGRPVSEDFPLLTFSVQSFDGLLDVDNLWGGRPYMIFSEKLRQLLANLGVTNIQYFPIQIQNVHTREKVSTFSIANIIGIYPCLDWQKSRITKSPVPPNQILTIESLKLDITKIPEGEKIFRLSESPVVILCERDVQKSLINQGVRGVSFVDVEDYNTHYALKEI